MKDKNTRSKITKRLIQESLTGLLKRKKLTNITIKELCQEAEINRSTFYSYYKCIDDVLDEMEETFLSEVRKIYSSIDFSIDMNSFYSYLSYVRKNSDHYLTLVDNGRLFEPVVEDALYYHLKKYQRELSPLALSRKRIIVRSAIAGCFYMTCDWLREETSFTIDEICDYYLKIYRLNLRNE